MTHYSTGIATIGVSTTPIIKNGWETALTGFLMDGIMRKQYTPKRK
jgi:hypothetical protein